VDSAVKKGNSTLEILPVSKAMEFLFRQNLRTHAQLAQIAGSGNSRAHQHMTPKKKTALCAVFFI
jgi:hypothetical protein